ncbi:MAG: 3,4-dehydroadipyl-CoA semialdehyde dehydrogenase [Deltaproteobacteria bacterium]|nr:MAG: 3,4-dehydroadipyl-CoA semialdehyde dehydrogenase [Deltaproteobacteria bacterium]
MTTTLHSYVRDSWVEGQGQLATLVNPATEEPLARTGTGGIDFGAALEHARSGALALREMTFAQRGELLRGWSKALHTHRDELLALAMSNGGNTRGDAKFDVDGGIATLSHYADLGAQLGSLHALRDGEAVQLGRTARYAGIHLWVPRDGVAVHINAFNFPAWGMAEKAAATLLAGMPFISKPATSTALVAFRVAELGVESGALPRGSFSFIAGNPGDLLDRLGPQDVVAFTGSSQTAAKLREQLARRGARLNVEADSLNAAVLGPDVQPGSGTWDLFVADVVRDMTQKAGQKCTAVRRIFVGPQLGAVQEALVERLSAVKVGDPARPEVGMGPVSTADQLRDVRAGIGRLAKEAEVVVGGDAPPKALAPDGKGYFVAPTLLVARDAQAARAIHEDEVFGPVATLCIAEADKLADLVRRGGGGLVCSAFSDDRDFLRKLVLAVAPYHGRIYLGSEKVAGQTFGPGTVLPQLVHGGPGHAGGGEELGGTRGMQLYSQRVALQGDRAILDAVAPMLAKQEA